MEARLSSLPDYAPIPASAFGPAPNEQGYYVGRIERNLHWVTDGVYQAAFLTTRDGVVLFDAPPSIGHNLQRAIDEVAKADGVSNRVTYLPRRRSSARTSSGSGMKRPDGSCCATTTRPGPRRRRRSAIGGPWRSAANGSSSPGTAPITRRTTASSTSPSTTR